jgi:hypothetical protein
VENAPKGLPVLIKVGSFAETKKEQQKNRVL